MSENPVRIPGGRHLSSEVHVLKAGERVKRGRGFTQKLDHVGNVLLHEPDAASTTAPAVADQSRGTVPQAVPAGDPIPNWVADAYWENATGGPVQLFITSWKVPQPPSTQVGQVIYLFNAMIPAAPDLGILQPVLQWGTSPSGGGPFWSVASYYVIGNGPAFSTDSFRVNPGDLLQGIIRLESSDGAGFNYISEFAGLPSTILRASSVHELVVCYETLETYGAYSSNSCYPADAATAFSAIAIQTVGNQAIAWTSETGGSNNGQRVAIVSGSEVDIYYR
jgi:hypothetical protein